MKIRVTSALLFYPSLLILLLLGCRSTTMPIVNSQVPPIPVRAPELPVLISADSSNSVFRGLSRIKSVVRYYQLNEARPVWIQHGKYTLSADSLICMLQQVQYYGLPLRRYHLQELKNIDSSFTPGGLMRKEVLLTDAFFALAQDLKYGVRNSQVHAEDTVYADLLTLALTEGSVIKTLESQEPAMTGYRSLKQGLRLTLDSLKAPTIDSISLQQKVQLISINLERWRAEKESISGRYILVNIPSFYLDVVENDSVILSSKVIVGTPEKQTPILSSSLDCFSIYPYWHVPRKIAVEEYLPIIKKDTAFIARNNFDVLDRKGNILNPDSVTWNTFHENYFPVSLRQREGPENSLGIVKFIFDNPYAVFLHDTNAKRLFNSKKRAFSHGCIRMEKAVELAHYLVTGGVTTESKTVTKYLKDKQRRWIELKNPIPIYTRYLTCEFKNGTLYLYKDIYRKDRQLYDLLYKNTGDVSISHKN